MLKYFQIYRNVKIQKLRKGALDSVVEFPFIDDSRVPSYSSLNTKLKACLDCIPPGCDAQDSPAFLNFVEAFYSLNFKWKEP